MRRSRVPTVVVLLAAVSAALSSTASAGGVDGLSFPTGYHVAGTSSVGRGELAFASATEATRQLRRGSLDVYLVPAVDSGRDEATGSARWDGPPPSARKVGRAVLRPGSWSASVVDVRATVRVPADLPPDDYSVVLCRGSCRRLTGTYQEPSPFAVVESVSQARLLRRLDGLADDTQRQLGEVWQQLDGTQERLNTAQRRSFSRSTELADAIAALRGDVVAAATRMDAELARTRRAQLVAEAAATRERRLTGGGIALLLVAAMVAGRRRPLSDPAAAPDGFEAPVPAGSARWR